MTAWQPSAKDCTDCDGTAAAKSDQWGNVTHYECDDCGCVIDAEDLR